MSEAVNLTDMLGGSEAPAKEASSGALSAGDGTGDGGTQAAAWTSQLSRELREDGEAFKKLADFKSVNELAEAFVKTGGGAGGEIDLSDFKSVMEKLGAPKPDEVYEFEKDLETELSDFGKYAKAAMLTKEQATKMLDGYRSFIEARTRTFLEESVSKAPELAKGLTDEFGESAREYYHRAISHNNLNVLVAKAGLGGNKDLARALCLLGKEMSEDNTPSGNRRAEAKPVSYKDGAMLTF